MTSIDAILRQGTRHREHVLRFLSPEAVVAASGINEAWYKAGAAPSVWASKLAAHPLACQTKGAIELESASMYVALLTAKSEHFEGCLVDSPVLALGLLYGLNSDICTNQLPLTHLLLRSPRLYELKPTDPIEGYPSFPIWQVVLSVAIRWGAVKHMRAQFFPWFISLYRWASSPEALAPHFSKHLLMPAIYMISSHESPEVITIEGEEPHKPPTMCQSDVEDLVYITVALIKKYFPKGIPSVQTPPEGQSFVPVADDDALLTFGVLYRLARAVPAMKDQIVEMLELEFGAIGVEQFKAAGPRVEHLLWVAAEVARKKEQEKQDRLAKNRDRVAAAQAQRQQRHESATAPGAA